MKLLHANDTRGQHAPSWYQATCNTHPRESLEHAIEADVCVIGAGFTGLSAALELAQCGISTVVLDAHRIGWGASGRNGGQLGTGFNKDQIELTRLMGKTTAVALWNIAEQAKAHVLDLCKQHSIDIEYKPGIVHAQHRRREVKAAHAYCDVLKRDYGYTNIEPLDQRGIRERVSSEDYHGGAIDHGAGHIHPLKLATGLARACEAAGVRIHETSEVLRIESNVTSRGARSSRQRLVTTAGSVRCNTVIMATNGYLDNLLPELNKRVMPINNFVLVTAPLADRACEILPFDDAVADSRFVVNYFRRVGTDRLLFGGGENYSYHFPKAMGMSVRNAMLGVFPQLDDVVIDYAWGGTLAITRNRLPYIARLTDSIYTAGGYSGHGVALAPLYGTAMAEHLTGRPERLDLLSSLPNTPFPGGVLSRPALLALAMTGYSWLDRL